MKNHRKINIYTGRGGRIMFENILREELGLPPLTQEQEDKFGHGAYRIGEELKIDYWCSCSCHYHSNPSLNPCDECKKTNCTYDTPQQTEKE